MENRQKFSAHPLHSATPERYSDNYNRRPATEHQETRKHHYAETVPRARGDAPKGTSQCRAPTNHPQHVDFEHKVPRTSLGQILPTQPPELRRAGPHFLNDLNVKSTPKENLPRPNASDAPTNCAGLSFSTSQQNPRTLAKKRKSHECEKRPEGRSQNHRLQAQIRT